MKRPDVKPGDWVPIPGSQAVVCAVRGPESGLPDLMVAFRDYRDRAISKEMLWDGDEWVWASDDWGGYADRKTYFRPFVKILREGNAPRTKY